MCMGNCLLRPRQELVYTPMLIKVLCVIIKIGDVCLSECFCLRDRTCDKYVFVCVCVCVYVCVCLCVCVL